VRLGSLVERLWGQVFATGLIPALRFGLVVLYQGADLISLRSSFGCENHRCLGHGAAGLT